MKHVIAAAALAATVALPASANCIPAKLASTFNEQGYVYLNMGPGVTPSQVVGSFYALGNVNANNGTYGANEWLFVDLNGLLSMQANLGDARVNGCPSGTLITRIYTTATNPIRFLTMTAVEGAAQSTSAFDYQFGHAAGDIFSAVSLPRPRVVASGSLDTTLIYPVIWAFDDTRGGNTGDPAGAVTGYELVRASGNDPGRNPDGWTVAGSVASDGSPVTLQTIVDCSATTQDQFFATRLLFNDGRKSDVVSHSTFLRCNPALAEPRFNVVPKRPTGARKTPTQGVTP